MRSEDSENKMVHKVAGRLVDKMWSCIKNTCCLVFLDVADSTWSVVDIGHGATFGGHVTQVYLLGLDLNLWATKEDAF